MRNTKDISDAVFRIRDEYLEQKRLKHKRMEKACAAVSVMAAAGIITAGAVHYASSFTKPGVVSVTDETDVIPSVTSVNVASSSATVSTQTTAVTAPSGTKTDTPHITSVISSAVTFAAPNSTITVSSAAKTVPAADTTEIHTTVTIDLSISDCEEVIRMKAESVKRYLAALSAAALVSGTAQMPVYAESLYIPNELDPLTDSIIYIEDNPELFDFDGSGKTDTFDAYALFTYVNEPSSLPEGYAERCKARGDVNNDGRTDSADSDLLSEIFIHKFSGDQFKAYYDSYNYLVPKHKNSYEYITRSLSDDAPEDVKENLRINEFIDSCYPYGSEKNINSFVELCFNNYRNGIGWFETFKYNDAYFKRFSDDAMSRNYSFDVNEDGVTDMKDLYDIYIYDAASADDFSPLVKENYFIQFNTITTGEGITEQVNYNYDVKLRDRLSLPEDEKQKLWDKCEPIYDYVYSFIDYKKIGPSMGNVTVLDLISRYIMNSIKLDYVNTSEVYFIQYHDCLTLCDVPVAKEFASYLLSPLNMYYLRAGVDPTGQKESPKLYTAIKDYEYMTNNDVLRAVDEQAKADCESGLTSDLYDINKDGKINGFDTYSFILYVSDLRNGITAENSVLPVDQWNFIDTKVDLDNDDIAGTFVDFTIFTYVTGFLDDVTDYELDIYYLELVEKKGLTDLSDIRPYIEKLCEDKETGDVDFDGMVTAADASQVLHYYSQLSVDEEVSLVTESMMQYMADCNVDGIVDSVDASAILAAYAQNSVLS